MFSIYVFPALMSETLEVTLDLEAMMASLQHSLLLKEVYVHLCNIFSGSLALKPMPQMKQTSHTKYISIYACLYTWMRKYIIQEVLMWRLKYWTISYRLQAFTYTMSFV